MSEQHSGDGNSQSNLNLPDTRPPFNSNFIVQPESFKYIGNENHTRKEKTVLRTIFGKQNSSKTTTSNNNQNSNDNQDDVQEEIPPYRLPIPNPILDEKDSKMMKLSFTCNDSSDIYKGIFNHQKSAFNKSPFKSKFVIPFADTKESMIGLIDHLVDCNKQTNWLSTKKPKPTITFYFPFHLITLTAIGFRSHSSKRFGHHFLTSFTIYGIDDDKKVYCLCSMETNQLNDYETKAIFPISSPKPLRAIHIRDDGRKFGLSIIDLFGTCTYNEIQEGFSKFFLTDLTTYKKIKVPTKKKDIKNPHKSLMKKIKMKMSEKDSNDDYYGYSSDDDGKIDLIPMDFEAYDANGPNLIQKYEERFHSHPEILNDNMYLSLITNTNDDDDDDPRNRKIIEPQYFFVFYFQNIKFKLTGIRIILKRNLQNLNVPQGFNFFGHLFNINKRPYYEWTHIFSSGPLTLFSANEYYYPIHNPNEFSNFRLGSYGQKFIIDKIEFFGKATTSIEPFEFPSTSMKKYFEVLFEEPPVGSFLDVTKPGIFETMSNYYGYSLIGFVKTTATIKNEYKDLYTRLIYSKDQSCSLVKFDFDQHKVQLTAIKITSDKNDKCLDHFYVITDDRIIAEATHKFGKKEEFILPIKEESYIQYFLIYNENGPFKISEFDIYGNLIKGDKLLQEPSKDFKKSTDLIMKLEYKKSCEKTEENHQAFLSELMTGIDHEPKIVYSARDSSSYKDILNIGISKFDSFVFFYCIGNNGKSILLGDENNLWLTSTNGDENSFDLFFPHHSVRLTQFGLHTPNDPRFEKYMPTSFYLYGYNSHAKHWDVILVHRTANPLEIMSYYTFNINNVNKNIYYRIIKFITYSGQVALSYIKLFGDVIEETDEPPTSVVENETQKVIKYKTKPRIYAMQNKKSNDGIFKTAMNIYGPLLKGFVIVHHDIPSKIRSYDIWDARDSYYETITPKKYINISFYFPYHDVYISGYQIKPFFNGGVDYWAILGCKNAEDEGIVLDHRVDVNMDDDDAYYNFKTNRGTDDIPFRIIRFVGLNGKISFRSLDFYGIAEPTRGKALTSKDLKSEYSMPDEVFDWHVI